MGIKSDLPALSVVPRVARSILTVPLALKARVGSDNKRDLDLKSSAHGSSLVTLPEALRFSDDKLDICQGAGLTKETIVLQVAVCLTVLALS